MKYILLILIIPTLAYSQFIRNQINYFTSSQSNYSTSKQFENITADVDFDSVLVTKLQYTLDSIHVEFNLTGTSACIVLPENVIWKGVSGFSDPEINEEMTTDMLMEIGSVTKTFIATLILMLRDEGKLSLEDSLHNWLPIYTNIDSSVTIRQLLNHTSGIADFINHNWSKYENDIFENPEEYWSPDRTLAYVLSPRFDAGTDWGYSNTNYILLGMIIKSATQSDTIAQVLREKILDPLELNKTIMGYEEEPTINVAHGWYDYKGNSGLDDLSDISSNSFYSSAWTAGAMLSTAEELAIFTRLLYRGDILPDNTLDEMKTIVTDSDVLGTGKYGLGTISDIINNINVWGHTGGTLGFTTDSWYLPENDLSIVVMTNEDPLEVYFDGTHQITIGLIKVIEDYYSQLTAVQEETSFISSQFTLQQNYPNPFNPITLISYKLSTVSDVQLMIYNQLGQQVRTLLNERRPTGTHQIEWDGRDNAGKHVASGVYLYHLKVGSFVKTRKMVLLR